MEPIAQNDVIEKLRAGMNWDQKVDLEDGGATVGPGIVFQTEPVELKIDADDYLIFDGDMAEIVMAYDDACLEGMISVHKHMFPRSSNMTKRDVESMFNPYVKRPMLKKVSIPIVDDLLAQGDQGDDMSREDFVKRVREGGVRAELIVELAGFAVDAHMFTPIVAVSEAALCPPEPPPKRKPRLTRKSPIAPVAINVSEKK